MRSARHDARRIWTRSCDATDVPLNADFEGGFADDPDGVAENVTRCVETGVAGLRSRTSTGDKDKPLYDLPIRGRAHESRARSDRQGRRRRAAHRPRRGLHRRRARSRRDDRADARPMRRPARIASMRRASRRANRSRRSCKAVAPKPVNFLIGGRSAITVETLQAWACAASASAVRSRARPGAGSCAWRRRSPNKARSRASRRGARRAS